MIKILIVDDYALVRAGVKLILESATESVVHGEASTVREALVMTKSDKWDLVLLDISLPDGSGIEVLETLRRQQPQLPILILSMHSSSKYAAYFIYAGASGYIQKDCLVEDLLDAVRMVLKGEQYIPVDALEALQSMRDDVENKRIHTQLSVRESRIFYRLCKGERVTDIGKELKLNAKTIGAHRMRILQKMNLKTNADLVYYAVKQRLID